MNKLAIWNGLRVRLVDIESIVEIGTGKPMSIIRAMIGAPKFDNNGCFCGWIPAGSYIATVKYELLDDKCNILNKGIACTFDLKMLKTSPSGMLLEPCRLSANGTWLINARSKIKIKFRPYPGASARKL